MENNKIDELLFTRRVIDNRQIAMTETVKFLLSEPETKTLRLAVGYFYLSGLLLIKDEFSTFMNEHQGQVQILMGNQTNKDTVNLLNVKSTEEYIDELPVLLTEDVQGIISEESFLKQVRQWISEGRIEVKVYTGEANYFHAKSYLFAKKFDTSLGKAIVGSSNFSKNGLEGNTELNVFGQDNYSALNEWFTELWQSEEVAPFSAELINVVSSQFPLWKDEQLYKPVLETYYEFAQLYGKPYAEFDDSRDWSKHLYPHQKTGVIDILDKLNIFGTAVLADGVGLGKTRTTAGIVKSLLEVEPKTRTLVLADNKLKVQWTEELAILGVSSSKFQYMSREKFALSNGQDLEMMAQEFDLIIVDEAHLGFKNRGTRAYRNLQLVDQEALRLGKKIKGLLLTATPWNNSRKDVLNLGSLFLDTDGIPVDRHYQQYFLFGNNQKVINRLVTDDIAFSEFWEDLFLQRTRKTYGGKDVYFAQRQFPIVEIPYEPRKNKIFTDNFDRISNLKFPYMDAIRYINSERNDMSGDRLKLMLLKRADSSWIAYMKSLEGIREKNNRLLKEIEFVETSANPTSEFKQLLARRYQLDSYLEKEIGLFTTEETLEDFEENSLLSDYQLDSKRKKRRYFEKISEQIDSIKTSKAKATIRKIKEDAQSDDEILSQLITDLNDAYQFVDEKYTKVKENVLKELSRGRKVIIISQFADTVKHYYELLLADAEIDDSNMGLITGNKDDIKIGEYSETKKEILDRFSPKSKNRQDIFGTVKEINLLLGTDTISTGQNLQDSVVLMNLDLPYNPMVLEQRIGRIDRPRPDDGVNEIFIYTFPVYEAIDVELKMSERLGQKMEGVLSDTEFDDIVLPEYTGYLEKVKKDKGKAVETMLDKTIEKTIFRSGAQSEKHSNDYKESNKRLYDMKTMKLKKMSNPVIDKFSFSTNKDGHSIFVGRIVYKDANGADLEEETRIFDLSDLDNNGITNAEVQLQKALSNDAFSTERLSVDKANWTVEDLLSKIEEKIQDLVNDYNNSVESAESNFSSLQSRVSASASEKIRESTRNPKLKGVIVSKLKEAGVSPKDVQKIANTIKMIDEDDERFEYVKEIDADINRFWLEFADYSEIFDFGNLKESVGAKVKRSSNRKANADNTKIEVLFGNIVIQ